MKRRLSISALSATSYATFMGAAFAQSANAYNNANCNASFLSCSGGGSAAPFGNLGSGGLETMLIAAVIAIFSWRVIVRKLRA